MPTAELMVRVETAGGIAVVTLDNPRKHNAMSSAMVAELDDVVKGCEQDPAVSVLVLTGAGPSFSAGADLSDPLFDAAAPAGEHQRIVARGYGLAQRLHATELALIAAVNGMTVGLGLSLVAHCDVRICSASASFLSGYARIGIIPDLGGSSILPRLVGAGNALRLALSPDVVSADAALTMGLVTEVVAPEEVLPRAMAFGRHLGDLPHGTAAATRRAMYQLAAQPVAESLQAESVMLAEMLRTSGSRGAVAAVLASTAERR